MTIRRRLGLSFLAILILFAANQALNFWGVAVRSHARQALETALTRQVVLASLRQGVENIHKQVIQVGQRTSAKARVPASPEERRLLAQHAAEAAGQIEQLKELTEPPFRPRVAELAAIYEKLAESWLRFYEFTGIEPSRAQAHLAEAESLTEHLLNKAIPALQEEERQRIQEAEAEFGRTTLQTNLLSLLIFSVSIVIALVVAAMFSRSLTGALGDLKLGAALMGSGEFGYRIPVRGNDEVADLANTFNDMAENLESTQRQVIETKDNLEGRNKDLETKQKLADTLLLNILPYQVALELQAKGAADPKYFEDATILFTDFVGFTLSTEKLAAEELVRRLHDYFTAFDQISMRYYLEKLKTIGDAYMCVGGLPLGRRNRRCPSHSVDAILGAFEMIEAVQSRANPQSTVQWAVRVGVHTGPLISGVVGIQKFAFDVWGDTVNYASRMESGGGPNRINVSAATYQRIKDFFDCEYRGKILTKEKKELEMYFVKGVLPSLIDGPGPVPPAFLRRYRVYFQKEPPAFPPFLAQPAPEAVAGPTPEPSPSISQP